MAAAAATILVGSLLGEEPFGAWSRWDRLRRFFSIVVIFKVKNLKLKVPFFLTSSVAITLVEGGGTRFCKRVTRTGTAAM